MFSMVTTMRRQTPELAELERYSRVIKNGDNMIARIVPLSDPSITGTELSQPLVDPFLYAFNIRWLKETGKLVEPTEKGERHPYQFAEIAYLDGCPAVEVYCDDSRQAFGVNTREELLKMRQMWAKR